MHYLILTTFAVVMWSTLAVLAAQLVHLPAFFILAVSLFVGGSLSFYQFKKWHFNFKVLCIGVLGIFGYHFLLFMAFRFAPPVSANLLNYLWPLFILLFTPLFFKGMHLTKKQVIGTLVAFSGASILVLGDGFKGDVDSIFGYSLALAAAVTWACYSLASKKVARTSSSTVGLFCLLSSGLSFVAHLALEQTPSVNSQDALLLFLLGIGPMGLAFYCWDAALKKGDPRVIASLSYLTPLLSTLLLLVFNNGEFSQQVLYALLLIVGGALFANVKVKKK